MNEIDEDILEPTEAPMPADARESWIGEQVRLLTLEDGFAA